MGNYYAAGEIAVEAGVFANLGPKAKGWLAEERGALCTNGKLLKNWIRHSVSLSSAGHAR